MNQVATGSVVSASQLGPVPIVLAVTGHRVIADEDCVAITRAVRQELESLTKAYPNSPLLCISGLAEGSDRLVARCAIEQGWQIAAVLPLSQPEYERDFPDPSSLAEFRELLERCVWIQEPADDAPRPDCYRWLADALRRRGHLLMALWDGEESRGPGGTAEVVEMFRHGVPLERPLLPDAGSVLHVQTRRATGCDDERPIGSVRTLGATPEGMVQPGENNRIDTVLTLLDRFNRDALRGSGGKESWGLPVFGEGSLEKPSSQAETARSLFLVADSLSIAAQSERDRLMHRLLALSTVAILLSQVYSGLYTEAVLLVVSVSLIGIGSLWYLAASRQHLEGRTLDYRALAEACRVQYYWKVLGIRDCAADHYLREQHDELEWIRKALQTTELKDDAGRSTDAADRIAFARHEWIEDQLRYFSGHSGRIGKAQLNQRQDARWSRRSGLLFAAASALTMLTALFHALVAIADDPLHDLILHWMMFGYCVLFAASGLMKVYQKTRAFAEHAQSYRRMQVSLQLTARRVDQCLTTGDIEGALTEFRSLGIEALSENGNWLLTHRERPVLVQGLG